MTDLSHWDFAENFSGYDAAALILGIEPRESSDEQWRIRVVTDRMELNYRHAVERMIAETIGDSIVKVQSEEATIKLSSVKLHDLHYRCWLLNEPTPLSEWLADKRLTKFEAQEFERYSIVRWLNQIGMKSVYQFERKQSTEHKEIIESDIDPADMPDELFTANIAFRAVKNGYGDKTATFKNRLIDYLENNYPDLSNEAMLRIATVANPDKVRGRKKSNTD